jgi:enoyl-CoA hydratase
MSNEILVDRQGRALHITINRPAQGNAMSDEMAAELTALVNGAAERADFVILRGAGEDFCIGRDGMGRRPPQQEEALNRRRSSEVVFDTYGALRRCPIPVIAVVQGKALGFGFAVAAACDITLAADSATFAVPEMRHNILPTMVMSALVDRVPRKALTYLVYSTLPISAERALTFGVVSDVAPRAELDAKVAALVQQLATVPRPAILGVKEYTRTALTMDVPGAIDYARNLHAVINASSEMKRQA